MSKKLFENYDDIVTPKELAEMLSVGKNTAYELMKKGEIKSIRIGKKHKIPKQSVIEFIEKNL